MKYEKSPAVYVLASRYRGTLYVGVTSDLYSRVCNHKNAVFDGFTKKYQIKTLVWYAHYALMDEAICREKQIKAWKRQWKIELVETINKDWLDLHDRIDVSESFHEANAGPQLSLG